MSENPEETLELCHDITKFVTKKAGKISYMFVAIIVFISLQNLPRSAVHGKERMSRHLKLCRDNYEMETIELCRDISKFYCDTMSG